MNVVSVGALAAVPVLPAYWASKAAAFSLTQSLRALLAGRGVEVHAVPPCPIDTDMLRDLPIPKTAPEGMFDGVENGDEDLFPDPMSATMTEAWRTGVAKEGRAPERGARPSAGPRGISTATPALRFPCRGARRCHSRGCCLVCRCQPKQGDVMAAQANEPAPLDRDTMVVAAVVLLGAVMSILDTTVVNVAIDHLAVAFNASLTTIQWVITGYTLALAAVIPVSGWAADRFGTKRIYMTSLVLFTLGSVAAGLSWSAESMIVFRVLQGIGGGLIMPTVMTIMTRKAGPHRMGRVMGVLGVPMLIAPIMGPILGGWLVADVSWRWIFFINVPIGVIAFILALIVLDRDQPQPAHRLDRLGMLLLSPGLAVFIYGLAESSTYGFGSPRSWGPTLAGVLLIAAWFVHSWRTPEPLIDIRTFTHTRAGYAGTSFFLFAISVFGTMLLIPLYYQAVRGTSALQAGVLLAPGGVGAMLLMPVSGRLTDRYGPTWLPATGLPLVAIGLIPFVFVGATTSYVLLCAGSFVQGLGMGLAMMPNMTAAMQAVPPSAIARTSTAMNIIRQAGASVGTAILSVILASAITSNLSSIAGLHASRSGSGGLAALQHLPAGAHSLIATPLANAFASTFVWALVMIVIAFIPATRMALSGWRAREQRSVGDHALVAE